MPLFDYRCEACGRVEELLIGADAEPGPCTCKGRRVRLLSVPADLKRMDAFYHKESFTNDDIARKGLTKYVNRGDGTYEKAAGEGPKIVNRNDLPD
jgi:putative FmdB family regulatory protein